MTENEVARAVVAFLLGMCTVMFGGSMLIQSRHKLREKRWPLPWETVAGAYMLALGVVFLAAALRLTPAMGTATDNKVALIASTTALVLALWTVRQWFGSERDTR
jgi:uncharacterized membrane protein YdcZ (DUF606 family)